MNCTIYLFGNFGQGITLYPDDYTKNIFKEFISRANAPTQLIIHRDGAIMNYGYIRRIENEHLFGICVQINGQYLTSVNKLFETFEGITTNIVVRGDIIRLNNQGNLISSVSKFTDKQQEVDRIISYSQTELSKISVYCQTLPNIDYSTSNDDIRNFKDTDYYRNIVNSSVKNGYTFIYKKEDYDSLALSGYRSTLYSLYKENETNKNKITELEKQMSKLKRQKKQMNVVVCLVLMLFVGSVIFFNTLDEKNKDIQSKQETIEIQTSENNKLVKENKDIHNRQEILKNAHHLLVEEHGVLDGKYDSLQREFNALLSNYKSVQTAVESKQRKIEELQSENNNLEIRCSNYSRTITRKDNDYSTLQKKYNSLSYSYDILSNKYYSTKEGKKELKKSGK